LRQEEDSLDFRHNACMLRLTGLRGICMARNALASSPAFLHGRTAGCHGVVRKDGKRQFFWGLPSLTPSPTTSCPSATPPATCPVHTSPACPATRLHLPRAHHAATCTAFCLHTTHPPAGEARLCTPLPHALPSLLQPPPAHCCLSLLPALASTQPTLPTTSCLLLSSHIHLLFLCHHTPHSFTATFPPPLHACLPHNPFLRSTFYAPHLRTPAAFTCCYLHHRYSPAKSDWTTWALVLNKTNMARACATAYLLYRAIVRCRTGWTAVGLMGLCGLPILLHPLPTPTPTTLCLPPSPSPPGHAGHPLPARRSSACLPPAARHCTALPACTAYPILYTIPASPRRAGGRDTAGGGVNGG